MAKRITLFMPLTIARGTPRSRTCRSRAIVSECASAEPDELIVPSRGQGKRAPGHRSVNHMLKKFRGDRGKLKIPERRQHDSRRTLISLARAGGANADALKVFTHGSSQAMIDA